LAQRAIDFARAHGVTTIAAEGHGHTNLGKPASDDTSPDHPVDADGNPSEARERTIDNSCKSMRTEARGVIGVTSVGPSKRKAYYSDYGVEQAPRRRRPRHAGRLAQGRERDPGRLPVRGRHPRGSPAE
jgi:lantibiotic leader peptide-processing serine protease